MGHDGGHDGYNVVAVKGECVEFEVKVDKDCCQGVFGRLGLIKLPKLSHFRKIRSVYGNDQ